MSEEFEKIEGYDISYTKTNDSDTLVAALLKKEPDFAIAPINIAAMMHNNGSGYRLAAITIWGIMHIVSDRGIDSLEELKGETIVAFGRSGTPAITLRAVLKQNNIEINEPEGIDFTPDPEKVNIVYLTAPSDVRDAIATGIEIGESPVSFALLAEPVATAITGFANSAGRPGVTAKINLQEEWAKNNQNEIYPQAALIFHERLLTENAELVNKFIKTAEQSSIFANNNPAKAGELAVKLGSIAISNAAIIENAYNAGRLPINFTYATEAKPAISTFLQILMEENPNLIGGKMPPDEFYYSEITYDKE
jgi:NitT/TauT family transport system substrate-binding protein